MSQDFAKSTGARLTLADVKQSRFPDDRGQT
jgi:hypothetical protein